MRLSVCLPVCLCLRLSVCPHFLFGGLAIFFIILVFATFGHGTGHLWVTCQFSSALVCLAVKEDACAIVHGRRRIRRGNMSGVSAYMGSYAYVSMEKQETIGVGAIPHIIQRIRFVYCIGFFLYRTAMVMLRG